MSHRILVWFVLYALSKLWTVIRYRYECGGAVSWEVAGVRWGEATPDTHVFVFGLLRTDEISSASFLSPLHLPPYSPPANPAQTLRSSPPPSSLPHLGLIWYVQWCDKTKREVFDCMNTPFGRIPDREESVKESERRVGRPRGRDWGKCKLRRKK